MSPDPHTANQHTAHAAAVHAYLQSLVPEGAHSTANAVDGFEPEVQAHLDELRQQYLPEAES